MLHSLFGAWRRAVRGIEQLQLWEVLRRRGTRKAANQNPQALAFAVERCTECTHVEECDRALKSGGEAELGKFCPNAMYLRHLDAMKRHAGKPDLTGPGT
jgi:hypothetical protein